MITREEKMDEFGKPIYVLSDKEKRDIEYTVRRRNMGSTLWKITCGSGPIPKALEGCYTNSQDAEDQAVRYLKRIKTSRTVRTRANGTKPATDECTQ